MSNFRLMLKQGCTWKPDSKQFAEIRPPKPPVESKADEGSKQVVRQVEQCHAFLEAFNRAPVGTNSYTNVGNYAVIGRGFAATVNLATLRTEWGRTRVHRSGKGRNLVLIGYPDPWATYVQHNMNQEVELLTLPGYQNRPVLPVWAKQPRWLDSRKFAELNAAELGQHLGEPDSDGGSNETFFRKHIQIGAGVTHIERVESNRSPQRFRLWFNNGRSLIASKVDICTGTGQQTFAQTHVEDTRGAGIKMSEGLWLEYLETRPSSRPRRVYSAEMYVAGDAQYIRDGSVLISSAASPAGIQAGEHALRKDTAGGNQPGGAAELVLLASAKINPGFPPIGRLDSLVRTQDGPLPMRLKTDDEVALYPTDKRVWFGESYRIVSIEELNEEHLRVFCHVADDPGIGDTLRQGGDLRQEDIKAGKLLVTLKPGHRLVRGQADGVGDTEEPLVYGLFDQVVFNTGRNRGGRVAGKPELDEGSAMQLVWKFNGDLEPIVTKDYEFPVGLQTSDQRLRILGAAGINNPIYKGSLQARNFERYEDSIPWQGRVAGEGVTLAAVTIAIANGFFAKTNPCVNTATLAELTLLLGGDADAARKILAMRRWRVRPLMQLEEVFLATEYWSYYFDRDELNELLDTRDRTGAADLDREVTRLRYMVDKINDVGFLADRYIPGPNWSAEKDKLKELEIQPKQTPPFDPHVLEHALLRYADYITDPHSRSKIRPSRR